MSVNGLRAGCLALGLLPTAAAAYDICDDLWMTRNTLFDRAGYCFGSALGQAVFDNAGCLGTDVALSAQDNATVALVREFEVEWSCRVDTSRTQLDLPDMAARMRMRDMPVPTGYESACIGWRGGAANLYSGQDQKSGVTGVLRDGDNTTFSFVTADGWEFVDMGDGRMGWLALPKFDDMICDGFAG